MVRVIKEKITKDLYLLRLDDDETRFFEALWEIPEGITYNAYVLTTSEGNVLFDGWKNTYTHMFLETLSTIVDPKDLDYIIVHHAEPDHSGSLPKILDAAKYKPIVLGHPMAKGIIEAFYNLEMNFKGLKDGEELKLGEKTLRYIYTPWLHWPETSMTYIAEEKILLSGDAFGGYSIPSTVFDEDESVVKSYEAFVRKYIATVIGHYRSFITRAVEKLENLNVKPEIIAPGHGLVWKKDPSRIINDYIKWAEASPEKGKALIVYSSMYGSVKKLVEHVVKELKNRGYNPITYGFTDMGREPISDIIGDALDAEIIIIGAATYEASIFPYLEFIAKELTLKASSPKPVIILSSYGWGGVAGKQIKEQLSKAGFNVVSVIELRGAPSEKDVNKLLDNIKSVLLENGLTH